MNPILRHLARCPRWLLVTLPIVVVLNYLSLVQWVLVEDIPRRIWSNRSYHPGPFPHFRGLGHGEKDYWTWKTRTRFSSVSEGVVAKEKEKGHNESFSGVGGCAGFPVHLFEKDIQVVLKVGAADGWNRTSSQLNSVIKCIPPEYLLIASDLDCPYGPDHNATDVLALLPPQNYMTDEDLAVYENQENSSLHALQSGHEGWKIDKYKFLPEVEEAVRRNRGAKWYVFLESDTYIFWDNMVRLLENYDERLPWYFGSPSPGREIAVPNSALDEGESDGEEQKMQEIWFAYGGVGFVLSHSAAHRLVDRKSNMFGIKGPRVTDEYRDDILNDCCGDSILGWALFNKAQVRLSGLYPMFMPHPLHAVPFGDLWCEPTVSLHKSRPEDFVRLWEWENTRDRTKGPLLYKDLLAFHDFTSTPILYDWYNVDLDRFEEESPEHPANETLETCREYCHRHAKCFQFTWHGRHCWMSSTISKGYQKDPDGEDLDAQDRKYVSGWDTEKIRRLMEEKGCDDGAHWVKPSVERIF